MLGRRISSFFLTASTSSVAFIPKQPSVDVKYATTPRKFYDGDRHQLSLRNATLDDVLLLLHWEEQPHLKDPTVSGDLEFNDWNWDFELAREDDISWRLQLIAEVAPNIDSSCPKPIGIIQLIDPREEETHYWGSDIEPNLRAVDIWIGEAEYLNKGFGTAMMRLALEGSFCFGDPTVEAVLVDPMIDNPRAHRFYHQLGFEPKAVRQFGPDKCLVHELTRARYFDITRHKA